MSQPSATRSDIDGLRAIAVGMVVLWHAWPGLLPGGFVGVDVFFVISGFLITRLITQGLDHESFSFGTFYLRRARRILPSLAVVLATVWTLGLLTLPSSAFRRLGEHVLGGALFASNVLLWREAGYFDLSATHKPLLHLWSLAVEEQFYLLWPLLLVGASKAGVRRPLLALLGLASLGVSAVGVYTHPTATFYLLPARGWELLAGAWLSQRPPASGSGAGARPLALITLALCALQLHEGNRFPGLWALPPVLATVVLLAFEGASPARRLLSWRPLVAVGRASYPLYLWHWPLLVLPSLALERTLGAGERGVVVVMSVLLAFLTTAWVERPVRAWVTRAEATPRTRWLAAAWLVAPILSLGVLGWAAKVALVETASQAASRLAEAPGLQPWTVDGRAVWDTNGTWSDTLWDSACVPAPGGKRIVFVGDSTLQATGGTADQNFVVALRGLLPKGWCVQNLSQAGYLAEQKAEVAQAAMRAAHVDLLVWGVWGERELPPPPPGAGSGPDKLSDARGPAAGPALPLPPPLADVWTRASGAADDAVARALGVATRADVLPYFEATRAEAGARGTSLLFVVLPELERPFGEPMPVVDEVKRDVRAWAESHHLGVVDLGERWQGKLDVEAVRLDKCCHYNAAGHQALARTFRELIDGAVGPSGASSPPTP